MKYLVIAALLILLLLLVYSRLRPYIQILKKILGTVQTIVSPPSTSGTSGTSRARVESKLVRCVGCGTWIPSDRAIGAGTGTSVYCSRECLEKPPKERQMAG
ncbi:MAG TPA: hypothetical protein VEW46_10335 [Pyrinomonadaceae bacterium]|nr:hypothetical protein [Pyrinomonadaceae bacterium]